MLKSQFHQSICFFFIFGLACCANADIIQSSKIIIKNRNRLDFTVKLTSTKDKRVVDAQHVAPFSEIYFKGIEPGIYRISLYRGETLLAMNDEITIEESVESCLEINGNGDIDIDYCK